VPSLTIWTRLEPRCRNADLTSALEARTHDPYWMLARQWQFGEMAGDDTGTPILAAVTSSEVLLDRFQGGSGSAAALPAGIPLETVVECEGVRPTGTTLEYRQAVDAGLYFLRLLRAGNVSQQLIAAYITQYAITTPTAAQTATLDAPALALAAVVARRALDGIRLAADLRAAQPGLPATPAVGTTDSPAVQNAVNAFLAWYNGLYDVPAGGGDAPTWVNERMEYHFSIDATHTDLPCAFLADQYTGEPLDWPSFDHVAAPLGTVNNAAPTPVTRTFMPSPVSFKGMPARRYWEMEDASIDIGAVDAGPTDLARLMLREFALIYGNDWFLVPVPVTVGSVARISGLVVTDTFGVSQPIPHYSETNDGGRWRMFAISGDELDHRLMMAPVLTRDLASAPQERVLLVRDDVASIAWGVEAIVSGASGEPIDRAGAVASLGPPPQQPAPSNAPLHYQFGTSAPEYYIPFVAQQNRMHRAALLRDDGSRTPITPVGRLLAPDVPLFEEEFIREGVRVERLYRMARWTDGSTHLWLARRKTTGAVAGSSGLQFDQVVTPGN
jgi:hypothetical protein